MNTKPILNANISIEDFRNFYWYKEELINFCHSYHLDQRGGKIELEKRIELFLKTGEHAAHRKKSTTSKFNWNNKELTPETVITDNYRNTKNVREFFKNQIGDQFKFNVKFMAWMKTAQGKTLKDATEQWLLIKNEMKTNKKEKHIAPQFEYNTYIRDFFKDNPDKSLQDAIKCWKIKKSNPEDNKYSKSDLKYLV